MEATKSFPDVVTSRGIDDFSLAEKEDYESLQKIHLTKQLRTGSGAELPGNMTLRKIVKPPKIHHRLKLKKKLDVLAEHGHHGERYRLLQLLRDVETKPSQFGGNIPTDLVPGLLAGNEDVAEVIYICDDESIKKSNALPINNRVIHLNSTMTTEKKHPKEYTQQDVTDFLSVIGLGHKSKEFEYNAVDGSMLATLTPEDFKNELGFTKLQTRKFIISYQQLIDNCASSSSMKNSSSNDNDPTKMKDNVNGGMRCALDHPMEKMILAGAKPPLAVEQTFKRRRSPSSVNKKKKQKMIRSSKNACAGNMNKKQKTASQKTIPIIQSSSIDVARSPATITTNAMQNKKKNRNTKVMVASSPRHATTVAFITRKSASSGQYHQLNDDATRLSRQHGYYDNWYG